MFRLKTGKVKAMEFFKGIPGFIGGNMRYAILGLFFIFFLGCLSIWHSYVQDPDWSDARKASYANSKSKDISFNQKKFDRVLEEKANREKEYDSPLPDLEDIFRLKK
ncbi:MAG: hypothetical protein HGB08_03260 [Candidatus Moranbacteria bacterium]|nr:hypothetical protein [Candidatus Moranbacteria bacterium]